LRKVEEMIDWGGDSDQEVRLSRSRVYLGEKGGRSKAPEEGSSRKKSRHRGRATSGKRVREK